MQIIRNLTKTTEYTAVALGYFDGVHLGHKEVIASAVKCKEQGLVPTVFTFSTTPKGFKELSDFQEKCTLFEKLGVEILYVIDFETVKDKSPEEFVKDVLKNTFNCKKVYCGFNYHFGKNGAGDTQVLETLCSQYEIETCVLNPILVDEIVVSSTEIRLSLIEGDIKTANKLLGYSFGINTKAVKGNHIGTKMGTPTINQPVAPNIVIPKYGVYASVVTFDGKSYVGVTNIGTKPTVGSSEVLWETWIPKYTGGDLYNKTIDVRLKEFIREEQKFDNLQMLKNQILQDGKTALKLVK